MPENKDKHKKAKNSSDQKDEIEELNIFIQKKKIQNVALKKIMAKLNTDENNTDNK